MDFFQGWRTERSRTEGHWLTKPETPSGQFALSSRPAATLAVKRHGHATWERNQAAGSARRKQDPLDRAYGNPPWPLTQQIQSWRQSTPHRALQRPVGRTSRALLLTFPATPLKLHPLPAAIAAGEGGCGTGLRLGKAPVPQDLRPGCRIATVTAGRAPIRHLGQNLGPPSSPGRSWVLCAAFKGSGTVMGSLPLRFRWTGGTDRCGRSSQPGSRNR